MPRIAWVAGLVALLICTTAQANDVEVRDARLRAVEEGFVLDADFDFELTPRLAEVLSNGVSLYFSVDFELTRRRWYWWDETAAERELQIALSYQPLSRHYRVSTGGLERSFQTLGEALDALQHLRGWLVVERTVTFADADYDAAVRMRLDTALLPKPFQLTALTSRELQLESPWRRFVVHSPRQLPAPVESREPRPAER
ncbi:MAG TPA: DUF4390 domain-containing protein [Burkholderiales bacterium]|nr:DUF4390 domain-containing protein [Burkholderiales bacterium]